MRWLTPVSAALALTTGACAYGPVTTGGADFPLAPISQFRLHQTTENDVRMALGTPFSDTLSTATVTKPGGWLPVGTQIAIHTLFYAHGVKALGMVQHGSNKFAVFVFVNDALTGDFYFNSDLGQQTSPIGTDRIAQLHKGLTTREQVLALFGPPSGQFASPLRGAGQEEAISYITIYPAGDGNIHSQMLVITFQGNGLLENYTSTDHVGPPNNPMGQMSQQVR